MTNTQPIEVRQHDENYLDVVKIWRTIQGEGPFAGMPAIFIRLAGCNLQCPGCDTDYTSTRNKFHRTNIIRQVGAFLALRRREVDNLVVITGGEPFRQNIGHLLWDLLDVGAAVQIETNGILYRDTFPYEHIHIVCSPKTASIHPKLREHISAYKYILQAGCISTQDGLPTISLAYQSNSFVARPPIGAEVFVQPFDEQDEERNKLNLAATVESSIKFGYRLSIQLHKLTGLE